jgi:hypothetical protein
MNENAPRMLTPDEFNVWRALMAFAVTDGILSLEEQRILTHHLKNVRLTEWQQATLNHDMKSPQDIEEMFALIEAKENKKHFCELARTIVWSDGDMNVQEKQILDRLPCLSNEEHKSMFKATAQSDFIREYMKKYEDAAFLASVEPLPIFRSAA